MCGAGHQVGIQMAPTVVCRNGSLQFVAITASLNQTCKQFRIVSAEARSLKQPRHGLLRVALVALHGGIEISATGRSGLRANARLKASSVHFRFSPESSSNFSRKW